MKFFQILLLVALVVVGAVAAATAVPPDKVVKDAAEDVLTLLRSDVARQDDVEHLVDLVEDKVASHFDFGRMTKLAVGKHWRDASDEQRHSLVQEFHILLVRTYSVALMEFRDYRIEYNPLKLEPDARVATVQTRVMRDGGKPFRMDYRMLSTDQGWKVYDVSVDGVSLVINYRSLFDSTVGKKGLDGLITMLRNKNAEARS